MHVRNSVPYLYFVNRSRGKRILCIRNSNIEYFGHQKLFMKYSTHFSSKSVSVISGLVLCMYYYWCQPVMTIVL